MDFSAITRTHERTVLTGFVLWARVAPEVDARLTQSERHLIRLHHSEWQSGDICWIVEAVGDVTAVQAMKEQLAKTVFAGQPFKTLA